MIKFFRQIRQNMIRENRASKYLLYAIGEIILVVIGILIALQINNWNQDRTDNKKAQGLLKELSANLKSDIKLANEVLSFNQKNDSIYTKSLRLLLNEPSDSIIAQYLAKKLDSMSMFYLFYPKKVAFENLKSSGDIDLIKNQELLNAVTDYYLNTDELIDGTQARIKEVVRTFTDDVTPILVLNQKNITVMLVEPSNWENQINFTPNQKAQMVSSIYIIVDNTRFQSLKVKNLLSSLNKLVVTLEKLIAK